MKFAQYLEDTQTPEWKRAYIDYRGLKKIISSIKKSQKRRSRDVESWDNQSNPANSRRSSVFEAPLGEAQSLPGAQSTTSSIRPTNAEAGSSNGSTSTLRLIQRPNLLNARKSSFRARLPSLKLFRGASFKVQGDIARKAYLAGLPLFELVVALPPQEANFVTTLDSELDKIDAFYRARETEMLKHGRALQLQLKELRDHRKLILSQSAKPWTETIRSVILTTLIPGRKNAEGASETDTARKRSKSVPPASTSGLDQDAQLPTSLSQHQESLFDSHVADPDAYMQARRNLKKAVLEHYRGLEVLSNYRILNVTGFRKALKKFEKVTKIPIQDKYMTEKVDRSALASDKAVKDMMAQMEDLFTAAFSHGNRKDAIQRLRAGPVSTGHYLSMYRSGIYLGLALPPLVDGLAKVFQQSTREALPSWNILLFLYAVLLVPVLFSLLVGLNMLVWTQTRINYVFIFELKVFTRLDYREYFELPTILLTTLCYCFWISFSLIGATRVNPTTWPLVWLLFALALVFLPIPIFHQPSRYWIIRKLGLQLIPGLKPVEFTDFWLGDQLCSLISTLSNLYTFACVYVKDFPANLDQCGTAGSGWPIIFALAALPLFIRLVQSIRRYADSGLPTHLINGGKYGTGIVTNFLYCWWRHNRDSKALFVLWCLSATSYSIYACTWDFLMDWSLLRIHNAKYPLLRENLLYTNAVYVYYLAMFSNLVLRFLWVIYIPIHGPSMLLRSFISAMLEMLRRVQWNFFRLENEHLGNMDQYRVTREVPLPYAIDEAMRRDDKDDEDDMRLHK